MRDTGCTCRGWGIQDVDVGDEGYRMDNPPVYLQNWDTHGLLATEITLLMKDSRLTTEKHCEPEQLLRLCNRR